MYSIIYNNKKSIDMGAYVIKRPNVPSPQKRFEEVVIAGRDGSLLITEGTFENIDIEVQLNYMSPPEEWASTYRRIKNWLQAPKGKRRLQFSDDLGFFYKVKKVVVGTNERTSIRIGAITPIFTCDPYMYAESGTIAIPPKEAELNPYDISKPIYIITGEKAGTLTVNGHEMTVNVGQNLTIDTDLMIAYREDGTLQNAAVTGNYENLYLLPGENTIGITDGLSLSVIPNWRTL